MKFIHVYHLFKIISFQVEHSSNDYQNIDTLANISKYLKAFFILKINNEDFDKFSRGFLSSLILQILHLEMNKIKLHCKPISGQCIQNSI